MAGSVYEARWLVAPAFGARIVFAACRNAAELTPSDDRRSARPPSTSLHRREAGLSAFPRKEWRVSSDPHFGRITSRPARGWPTGYRDWGLGCTILVSKASGRRTCASALTDPVLMASGGNRMTILASRSGQSGLPPVKNTSATTQIRRTAANRFAMISPSCMQHPQKEHPPHRR